MEISMVFHVDATLDQKEQKVRVCALLVHKLVARVGGLLVLVKAFPLSKNVMGLTTIATVK